MCLSVEENVNQIEEAAPLPDAPFKSVTIYRTNIRADLINVFNCPNILDFVLDVTVIDANGNEEKGKGKGVMLDVLTHFWQEFFTAYSAGSNEKTPFIRHDLQKPQWEAIGKIIVYGYRIHNYFPLKLSQITIATCLFGEECLNNHFLMMSFRSYVAHDDREVLDKCLGEDFDPDDEEMLDFLSMWKCYKQPTKENIESIIFELAHQELVQKPRYIVNCWTPILMELKTDHDPAFQTQETLSELYESRTPTAKKVIKLLKVSPLDDMQRQTLNHLKKYIKSLEGKALERLLHFITGSDIICFPSIEVTFNNMSGKARRPVVHICGPLLELSTTYESYTDMAEEFTNIMREQQGWSFDIV